MNVFNQLESVRKKKGAVCLALIDPESDIELIKMSLNLINNSSFDAILFGGSYIGSHKYFNRNLKYIKKNTSLPIILFPGSACQIGKDADAVLFLNLISGRNVKYLIEEQVNSSQLIYDMKIESIPTAYIVLGSNNHISSVSKVTNTKPLNSSNIASILSHCLAGQYMGNNLLYLEMGSGSKNHISPDLLKIIKKHIKIPIVVGGGINKQSDIKELVKSGANYIVIGTLLEQEASADILDDIINQTHYLK